MIILLFKGLVFYFFTLTHIASSFTFNGLSSRIVDPKIVENLELSLVERNGVKQLNGTYAQRIEFQFVESNLKIDLERAHNKRTRFLDMKLNVCKFLDGKYEKNQVLRFIRKSLIKSKTFRRKCPLPAHHVFEVDMLDLGTLYTGYLPNVSFFVTFTMHNKRHLYIQLDLNGYSKI